MIDNNDEKFGKELPPKPEVPVPITPSKLIGKDVDAVVDRMKSMNLSYRVVTLNGLITADFQPDRYNLLIKGGEDCDNKIIDCTLG